ncbi:MAG: exodeoxyribonuclease VII large subunit [Bacteroidota bacterium]|jgi:exodeoxyribonuclease VII large subunit
MATDSTVLSVSELTRRIKGVLETGFTRLAVQGEISNFKRHSSGHLYFTLKDESAQLQAVMWRSRAANLFFTPQDGMKVIVRGNITVYEVRGIYQIDVAQIQPLGVGELQIAFEQLKQKLAAEGLFDAGHKRPIPEYPESIGIVTSKTGAALQDIVNIISRRFPAVELILYPVKVQGVGAAEEIASAIREFNAFGKVDVLIVGRGGGSLEDLWAFNEEVVARAIYASRIPVISAVGHEIDFTIADFVADLRAPTPSAAAELAVRNGAELVEIVRNFHYTAQQIVGDRIASERKNVGTLLRSHSFNKPVDLVRRYSQQLDELRQTLARSMVHRVELVRQNLVSLQQRVTSVNPDMILKRGYVMVVRDGSLVTRARELRKDDLVRMKFDDGDVPAKVQ